MTQGRRLAAIAVLGAVAASAGDLLMLWVGNARRPELGLPLPGDSVLWLGAALGVIGIPLYALGYRAAALRLLPTHPRSARCVTACGALVAVFGAGIHALTARLIAEAIRSGAPGAAPLDAVAAAGPLLVALWAAAGLATLVASIAFVWGVRQRLPLALANPALGTLALGLAAQPDETLRSFLAPAAPNLAHVLFFLVCSLR